MSVAAVAGITNVWARFGRNIVTNYAHFRRNIVKPRCSPQRGGSCIMGIEYIAGIKEHDYGSFRMILSTPLPRDYQMWLRVRARGKFRAHNERGAVVIEILISPMEFGEYCRGLKRRDFSIASLDRCARAKAFARKRTAQQARLS